MPSFSRESFQIKFPKIGCFLDIVWTWLIQTYRSFTKILKKLKDPNPQVYYFMGIFLKEEKNQKLFSYLEVNTYTYVSILKKKS